LIVEDEYFLIDELSQALATAGFDVAAANGATTALDMIDTQSFDLMVLDINLAGEMVFPLARVLQARDSPFIFISGYDRDALPAEFDRVRLLRKPYDPDEVIAAIRDEVLASL
jgi:DNA-binding response OmpR family regulator